MSKYKVNIYDTLSKKFVEVEVSKELYIEFKRTAWNIKDNNASFYAHEIQFSSMKGDMNNSCENFHEMISEKDAVETRALSLFESESVSECLSKLSVEDRKLIEMLFFDGKTEQKCAEELGTTQQNIHKKKSRILCRLNKLLNKYIKKGC